MSVVKVERVPKFLYGLDTLTDEGRPRWQDEFAGVVTSDFIDTLQTQEDINILNEKDIRDQCYSMWLAAKFKILPNGQVVHGIRDTKKMKFQAVRVYSGSDKDWWSEYRDCVFYVFMNPETRYDSVTKTNIQYYVLSPEDSYYINKHKILKVGGVLPPRDYNGKEKYISLNKHLRKGYMIPCKSCKQLATE